VSMPSSFEGKLTIAALVVSALAGCASAAPAVPGQTPAIVAPPSFTPTAIGSPTAPADATTSISPSGTTNSTATTAEAAVCLGSIQLFNNVGLPSTPPPELVASFVTTTGKEAIWKVAVAEALGAQIGYNGPSPSPGGDTVYLCYFDGDFGPPRGPVASGVPDWSRVVVEIDAAGRIELLVGGFGGSIPVIDPNDVVAPSPVPSDSPSGTPTGSILPLRTFAVLQEQNGVPVSCPAFGLVDPVFGHLDGDGNIREPVWLRAPDGGHLSVVWPEGFTAVFGSGQLAVADETGFIAIQMGDAVQLQIMRSSAEGTFDDPYYAYGILEAGEFTVNNLSHGVRFQGCYVPAPTTVPVTPAPIRTATSEPSLIP
jgi:hypothetical protein